MLCLILLTWTLGAEAVQQGTRASVSAGSWPGVGFGLLHDEFTSRLFNNGSKARRSKTLPRRGTAFRALAHANGSGSTALSTIGGGGRRKGASVLPTSSGVLHASAVSELVSTSEWKANRPASASLLDAFVCSRRDDPPPDDSSIMEVDYGSLGGSTVLGAWAFLTFVVASDIALVLVWYLQKQLKDDDEERARRHFAVAEQFIGALHGVVEIRVQRNSSSSSAVIDAHDYFVAVVHGRPACVAAADDAVLQKPEETSSNLCSGAFLAWWEDENKYKAGSECRGSRIEHSRGRCLAS